jgi:hypothetical protein
MRIAAALVLALVAAGCSTTRPAGPREYLDEKTAATITVVSDPWIFTREQFGSAVDANDFLNLYAIDVNRMGEHRQYLAVLQSVPLEPSTAPDAATDGPPKLELRTGEHKIVLEVAAEDPQALGIAQPIAASYTLTSRWWYFPVSKQTLTTVAGASDLTASMQTQGHRVPYVMWRDGRAAVAELTAVLP